MPENLNLKLINPNTGELLPPLNLCHFERLNIEKTFMVGENQLEKNYISLSRKLHPDLFIRKSEQQQRFATAHTIDLNDSYEILKSPLKRSEYLLSLENIIVNQDNSSSVKPSQKLLMESLIMREELEEVNSQENIISIINATKTRIKQIIENLAENFTNKSFDDAAQNTIHLRYLNKLLQEAKTKASNI